MGARMHAVIRPSARCGILLLGIALSAGSSALDAQDTLSLAPGARVRVSSPSADLLHQVGSLSALRGDTLLIRFGDAAAPTPVPLMADVRLEVSRGRERHTAKGAAAGFGAMLLLGFLGHPGWEHTDAGPVTEGFTYGVVFGIPAALLGGVIGASIRTERWERVSPP